MFLVFVTILNRSLTFFVFYVNYNFRKMHVAISLACLHDNYVMLQVTTSIILNVT